MCKHEIMKKSFTVGEFKQRFSEALQTVREGGTVEVTYGRSHRPVAMFTPVPGRKKRRLGVLSKQVKVRIKDDWELSDRELLES